MSVFGTEMNDTYVQSLLKVGNKGNRDKKRKTHHHGKLLGVTAPTDEGASNYSATYFKRLYKQIDRETCYKFAAWFLKDTKG